MTVLEKRIKEYSNNNIFDYAVPYQYYFIEDLRYTKNGKVDVQLLERKTSDSI
ncbi:MAG: hypothetical protein U0L10_16110 [Lachnospiraceae bacterium]|nr:hypothetical protein [Lachnospiraceae bacterium]